MSLSTSCTLNIVGNNSNEAYTVVVPSNILGFCRYNFSRFMEECSRLCLECMKSGEYPLDRVISLRNSISGCHRYVENNIRTVFEKIVVDCWIEYICRQGEITTTALWNSLIDSRDPFQNAIFQRLTEYRTHRAINQWINILKIQEYAKKKIDFIFGCKLASVDEAAVRLNFFDLMFSVAANEQGYALENIGSVKFCKPGRTVGAPFVYGGVSKEIVKNLFKEVHFADSQPYISREEGVMSDWEAMDAFAVIKNYLPDYNDSVAKIIQKSLTKIPDNVFAPSCFKAMIDLEIDSVVNMGGYLQHCAKCGEYYLKNEHYTSDYCDTVQRDGSTCRELMESDIPEPLGEKEIALFNEKAEGLYRKMAEKVNFEISQRDFAEWSGNFNVMRNNVISGRATDSDFDDFVEYSEQLANQKMSRAKQSVLAAVQEEMIRPDGTRAQVRPYQFTRVDRKELEKQGMLKPADSEEKLPPISEQKKAAEKPTTPVAKIIRGASPTSYHEIPVQSTKANANANMGNNAVIPIKSDVFTGEDFSRPAQNNTVIIPNDDKISAAAKETQREILNMAEQERVRLSNENPTAAQKTGVDRTNQGYQSNQQDKVQSYSPVDEESGEKKDKPHFPDLEDFPVDNEEIEADYTEYKEQQQYEEVPRSAENNVRSGNEESRDYSSKAEQVKRQWQNRYDVELHAEEAVKRQPPQIKLPEFEEDKKDKDNFVTLVDSRERAELLSDSTILEDSEPKEDYFEVSRQKAPKNIENKGFEREEILTSDLSEKGKDQQGELPKAEKPAKKSPQNRAAKVAGAYRSVAQMPRLDKQGGNGDGKTSTADEFAQILSNIERNDGFDEENLPLDPDGVPLSHKTKHVMDALMRNSGVSPSLTYGRRQAAEKNVIIDEDYLEKTGKKPVDKK